MKKILYCTLLAFTLLSCKPDAYVGPLDSPLGNWDGIGCEYFFNGELVALADSAFYPAMTFYKEGLCCIEGMKGAFPYGYDPQTKILQIDSLIWAVENLHTEDMTLKLMGRIYPSHPDETVKSEEDGSTEGEEGEGNEGGEQGPQPDSNGIILPVEYKGFVISADENDYFYTDGNGNKIYCTPVGTIGTDGLMVITLWYDTRTDHYGPLIVEVEKK